MSCRLKTVSPNFSWTSEKHPVFFPWMQNTPNKSSKCISPSLLVLEDLTSNTYVTTESQDSNPVLSVLQTCFYLMFTKVLQRSYKQRVWWPKPLNHCPDQQLPLRFKVSWFHCNTVFRGRRRENNCKVFT